MPVLAVDHVDGAVVAVHSHWTTDRSRIVTDATVQTATGAVVVSQLGGTVDGLTMRTFPGPAPLVVGMAVALGTHDDLDASRVMHTLVDTVRVLAEPAGFVRTGPTGSGHYLYWESSCVQVTVDSAGTKEIPGDQEFAVIDAAIAEWTTKTAGCSYFSIQSEGRAPVEVGTDMVNVIKFRDSAWCRPAVGNDPARCYSSAAAGITTAVYVDDANSPRDGAIVDADVEINGADFAIAIGGATLGNHACKQDLANTLTHELGHLQGLEHTCTTPGDPPRLDGDGQPVPACNSTDDPKITLATMYNYASCDETSKATLEPDDVAGICRTYPTAASPGACHAVGDTGGCCSVVPRAPGTNPALPVALLPVAGLGAFVLTRRRRAMKK